VQTGKGSEKERKRNDQKVEEETKLNSRHLILPLYSNSLQSLADSMEHSSVKI
jgi:hypothetical protein